MGLEGSPPCPPVGFLSNCSGPGSHVTSSRQPHCHRSPTIHSALTASGGGGATKMSLLHLVSSPALLHHDVAGIRTRPLFLLFIQDLWGLAQGLVPTSSQQTLAGYTRDPHEQQAQNKARHSVSPLSNFHHDHKLSRGRPQTGQGSFVHSRIRIQSLQSCCLKDHQKCFVSLNYNHLFKQRPKDQTQRPQERKIKEQV